MWGVGAGGIVLVCPDLAGTSTPAGTARGTSYASPLALDIAAPEGAFIKLHDQYRDQAPSRRRTAEHKPDPTRRGNPTCGPNPTLKWFVIGLSKGSAHGKKVSATRALELGPNFSACAFLISSLQ